ncbi:MAG TPA: proline dehydrogenase family protein [Bacteroidota bacterium]|nr:proline dehydrogenase family protein [Bacteroidota bacterium]
MSLARSALLWISENRKLRESLPRLTFVRRAVTRFMPGETVEEALPAAIELKKRSINTIFTQLGENITTESEAAAVRDHYLSVLDLLHQQGLNTYVSVKLTQLGLDLDTSLCLHNVRAIAGRAKALGNMVWIDIEQSQYVDRTIDVFTSVRDEFPNTGLCLQAYLYRTQADLNALLPLHPAIRLVKGAYKEPPSVAFPRKEDVDRNYLALATLLLENVREGAYAGFATHDTLLHAKIQEAAGRIGLSRNAYEFQMLYGINMAEQYRLADEGYAVRNLISYGSYWFPWYIRRLAERPANIWFVMKNLLS